MPHYDVNIEEKKYGYILIRANSKEEAIKKARQMPRGHVEFTGEERTLIEAQEVHLEDSEF